MINDQETEFDDTSPKAKQDYRLEDLVGHVLDGRYEIDEVIGTGAMGAVYRARQLRLRRTVAIKVPKPNVLKITNYGGRFEREALTMAKLVHQNIVQIFDVYLSNDPKHPSFIAMEFVQGREFGEFIELESKNLTVSAVLLILEQIAAGLDAAHAYGVVHRDVKPANVMITMPQRIPKIMDFGIAKVELEDAFQTLNMETLGTPAYMSPEQVTGGLISSKTDVYSFGIMAYKTLTGHFPYDVERSDIRHVMQAHVNKTVIPASTQNTLLPKGLDRVFEKVLNKNPGARSSSATDFMKEVRAELAELEEKSFSFFFPSTELEHSEATMFRLHSVQKNRRKKLIIGVFFFSVIALVAVLMNLIKHNKSTVAAVQGTLSAQATPPLEPVSVEDSSALDEPEESSGAKLFAQQEPTTIEEIIPEEILPDPTATPQAQRTPVVMIQTPTPAVIPKVPVAENEFPPSTSAAPVAQIPMPTTIPVIPSKPALVQIPAPQSESPAAKITTTQKPTTKPIKSLALITAMQKRFVQQLDKQIENPSFYGKFSPTDNALTRLGGPEASSLVDRMRQAASTHGKIDLSFKINSDSLYWENYCELQVVPSIRAYPLNHPDRSFREVIYVAPKPVKLIIIKNAQGTWEFECLGCS
ncbi:MAG: protein kinase [Sumerlaeia bacterium]